MLRSIRTSTVIFTATALALLVAISLLYAHFHVIQSTAVEKAHDLIREALSQAVGRKVEVGAISSGGLDSVVL
ncbi:MAG: hypothetical protein ACOYW4_05340, partial [Bacillota bacterium]